MKSRMVDELIQEVVDGDGQAWQALWRAVEPTIWALTGWGRVTGPIAQREDDRRNILLEVMGRLRADDFSRLRRYLASTKHRATPSSFKTWLATVTVIDLTSKDYRTRRKVHVRAGEVTRLVVPMTPNTGHKPSRSESAYLSVACSPRCDSVSVDGVGVGPSPVVRYRVAPGQHRLELRSGNVTRPVVVLVKAGETKDMRIGMEAPSEPAGD